MSHPPAPDYFEQSPTALSVTDLSGRIVNVNAAYAALFGRSREDLIGSHVSQTMPASEWAWTQQIRGRLIAGEIETFRSTKQYLTAFDAERRLDVAVATVRDPDGTIVGLIAAYDFALDHSTIDEDAYLRRVLAASRSTLMTVDQDGVIVSTSGRYQEAFGYPADFWSQRRFIELVVDDDRERFARYLANLIDHPEVASDIEVRVHTAQGTERVVLVSGSNLLADPAVTAIVLSLQDVSDLHDRISGLIEDRRIAESVAASRADLIATVSHELRNPLHALQGLAELLATSSLPGELAEISQELYAQLAGLASVTSDLLETARADRGEMTLKPVPTNVDDLLRHGVKFGQAAVGTNPVEVVGHLEVNTPPAVLIDGPRVDQIIRNLVGNAAKFTESGFINVTIGPIAHGIHITVADTGVGIPQADLESIMEPFERGSNTGGAAGAGLGLAIITDLTKAMDGKVLVDSKLGRGSTFRVELKAPVSVPVTQPAKPERNLENYDVRVLVVDDDRTNRLIAVRQLERFGCTVEVAQSGAEAIETLSSTTSSPFDVVLLDRRMPGMDGVETVERIRSLPGGERLHIIGLSASASASERSEFEAASMDDFVAKPASLIDLHEAIGRFVSNGSRDRSPVEHSTGDTDRTDPDADRTDTVDEADGGLVDRERIGVLVDELGDVGLAAELIEMFTGDLPALIAEANDAQQRGDLDTVSRVAHTVKGSAAMLGAPALREVALEIEKAPDLPLDRFASTATRTMSAFAPLDVAALVGPEPPWTADGPRAHDGSHA